MRAGRANARLLFQPLCFRRIMATWQFSIVLLPASWAEENSYDASLLYDEEGYSTECAWRERQPGSAFIDVLSKILPPSQAWHDDLLTWGKTEEHDIQVWYEDKEIEGIHIRLDLNQNSNELIAKLIEAAQALKCALFLPEYEKIIEANEFELTKSLKESNAAKFVMNPKEFLNEISKET